MESMHDLHAKRPNRDPQYVLKIRLPALEKERLDPPESGLLADVILLKFYGSSSAGKFGSKFIAYVETSIFGVGWSIFSLLGK